VRGFSVSCGVLVGAVLCMLIPVSGQTQKMKLPPVVRIAELEIDADQILAYKHALSDEIATSIMKNRAC
jgi:hypothetical protein